jgi:hypothetical protein
VSVARTFPFAGTVTLFGLIFAVGPMGETPVERFTVPVKPSMLTTVIVEVEELPWVTVREVGIAFRE